MTDSEKNAGQSKVIAACQKTNSIDSKEALYKEFYSYAMSVSLRYAYTKEEASEITNDAFMKVFKNINSYNPSHSFKSWLRRIIINTAIDNYRKEKRHYETKALEDFPQLESGFEDVISRLTVDDILAMLKQLPETQRLIFNLYEMEGFSHAEIAQRLQIPIGTSRSYLTRSKLRLRQIFAQTFDIRYEK